MSAAAGPPRYVSLTQCPHVLASIIAGALEAEGLDVRLSRDGLGAVYGLDTGRHATHVEVAVTDLDRARRLLAEVESAPP